MLSLAISFVSDGFGKSPYAVLCCNLRHFNVQTRTPHSSDFARLASNSFSCAVYPGDTFLCSIHSKI